MTDLSAEFKALAEYRPTNKVRFVTAASLFDGHDAAINIMRRILQGAGASTSRSSAAAAGSSCRPRFPSCRATASRASTAPRTASAWACRE